MKNNNTNNNGHDVARHNLQDKLSGYNFKAIMHDILKHPIIKELRQHKAIKVVLCGNNYHIKCMDNLLSYYRKTNKLTSNVTVVQVVNNICTNILSNYNLVGVGKTQFWYTDNKAKTYNKVIIIGNDILSTDFMKKVKYYGNKNNTFSSVTLSERAKLRKYN